MKSRRIRAGLILWCVLGGSDLAGAADHALVKASDRVMVDVNDSTGATARRDLSAPAGTIAARARSRAPSSSSHGAGGFLGIDHYLNDRLPSIQSASDHP